MKKRILPLVVLLLGISLGTRAQAKDKVKKEKESDLIIRKKGEAKEKMTIVIDGNEITINGKPLDELKDSDVEVFNNKGVMSDLLPRIKSRLAPLGELRISGDDNFSNRAFLGVTSGASEKGAKIVSVQKGSPAEKAGFKKDDIITRVNDTKIENGSDLYDAIGQYKPGEKVTITALRDDKATTATVTLEKNAAADVKTFNFKNGDFGNDFNLNMDELRNLPNLKGLDFNFNRKPKLGIGIQDTEDGKGVKILEVDEDTPAARAGLKKDDVISEIDGKTVSSVDDLQSAVRGMKEGNGFKLTYKRGGQTQTAEIKFPKKLKTAEL